MIINRDKRLYVYDNDDFTTYLTFLVTCESNIVKKPSHANYVISPATRNMTMKRHLNLVDCIKPTPLSKTTEVLRENFSDYLRG